MNRKVKSPRVKAHPTKKSSKKLKKLFAKSYLENMDAEISDYGSIRSFASQNSTFQPLSPRGTTLRSVDNNQVPFNLLFLYRNEIIVSVFFFSFFFLCMLVQQRRIL
jgi:hypothetical protein